MKKRSLSLSLSAALLVSGLGAAGANAKAAFADLPEGHWAEKEIQFLQTKGIVSGYKDGTYQPGALITRSQAAVVFSKVLNLDSSARSDVALKDIAPNHRVYKAVAAVVSEGLLTTDSNGAFHPDAPLSRAELAEMIAKAFKLEGSSPVPFSDVTESAPQYKAIQALVDHQITAGTNGLFSPDKKVSRAELAALLARAMDDTYKPDVQQTQAVVLVNGVPVVSKANHVAGEKVYVDVAEYVRLVNGTFNEESREVNSQAISIVMKNGVATADVDAIAKLTGAEKVTWDQEKKEAYVLDLPDGTVQITPAIPGMGEHWANPADMPIGPIYGVEQNKLVFLEYMVPQEDFVNGKNYTDVKGMKGLPSPIIDHTDFEFQPAGHEGMAIPHYDIHSYFVSHEEHAGFGMPKFTSNVTLSGRKLAFDWDATNFILSVDNYGKENVPGEGHAHLYIKKEGEEGLGKKYGVKTKQFELDLPAEEYPPGKYVITASLETNDHQHVPVDMYTFNIEVK